MIDREAFAALIAEEIGLGLPGFSAHVEMDPLRGQERSEMKQGRQPRQSAVLILCFNEGGKWKFPLIQRPTYEGTHSGQIALPGGKQELGETYIETALREANEEIGVNSGRVQIIGELSDIYIPPSNFNVRPVIGVMDERTEYILDQREVVEVIEVSVDDLIDARCRRFAPIKVDRGTKIQMPCFDFGGKIVWGATAMILSEMAWVVNGMYNNR